MDRRRVTVAVAAVGVVAGVVGLGVLAMPAGAGPAPELPEVGAEALVESVLTAEPAAFGGAVEVSNDLGIPGISGLPQLSDGDSKLRVWTDGEGRVRVQLPARDTERTFVDDGQTGWLWDSADQQVTRLAHGQLEQPRIQLDPNAPQVPADPVAVAREAVAKIKEFSDVSVDGTARVADRPAYELVLTPKPTERTVLREVRVAVDSELRIPLRFEVLTNGTPAPAVQIGFSELNVGPQDAALFSFTPPPGAKVSEPDLREPTAEEKALAEGAFTEADPQVVGEGWDQVLTARVPADALKNLPAQPRRGAPEFDREGRPGQDVDVQGLLKQVGKQVSGSWGSGTLITTRVGAALIADDGRVAVGAVPEQVLVEAIGQVK